MENIVILTLIFLGVMTGCGRSCYKLGKRDGIIGSVNYLADSGDLNHRPNEAEALKPSWLASLLGK